MRFTCVYANTPPSAMAVPRALMGLTGVWKKITADTMTTTRFTQFPMECVTGVTWRRIV